MRNPHYDIGNRILDLTACSAVPQPTPPLPTLQPAGRIVKLMRLLPVMKSKNTFLIAGRVSTLW
jgi:hypothetical protein